MKKGKIVRQFQALVLSATAMALAPQLGAAPRVAPSDPPARAPGKPVGDDLAVKYASGMESTTNGLEKVIEAQANQIAIFSYMVAAMGVLLTLGGFGLYQKLIKTVESAVDTRVASIIADGVDTQNSRSIKLHAAFLETTFSATKNITASRQRNFTQRVRSGELSIETPEGLIAFVKLQSEILLLPLTIVEATYALAAEGEDASLLHEKVWVLFGEVAAGHIRPAAMLRLVTALINVLHYRRSEPLMLEKLSKFAAQLKAAVSSNTLPEEPSF